MGKEETFYLEGKDDIGILLNHSLGADPSQMIELGKKLNKKGYSVYCPLYDGHAKELSDLIASDVDAWYKNVMEGYDFLKTKGLKVAVIGMSIGGTFAVKLAEEKDVFAVVTVNAPVIGFDVIGDTFAFGQKYQDKALIETYHHHREQYFKEVTKIGQIEHLKKITAPFFVIQGSKDLLRYKTSSHMLMTYISSEIKQRKDYKNSFHLALLESDKKTIMKDIIKFLDQLKKEL
jgi:carboxylesterase